VERLRKAWDWVKARPRWIWGILAGLGAGLALALKTSGGGDTLPPARADEPVPAPPRPVPPVLREEAAQAAAEAEEAREAPATLDAREVAAGLARHDPRRRP
jgi:hypothetical protein